MEGVGLRASRWTTSGGFTLIEVLVGCSVLMVLMTMVYQVVGPSMRLVHKAESDTETQQAALLALDEMFMALRHSDPRSITVLSSPPGVAFLSPRPPGTPGLPPLEETRSTKVGADTDPVRWASFEVLYHDEPGSMLLRKQAPYAGGTAVARMTPAQVEAFLADARYPVRVAGRHLRRLRVSRPRPPAVLLDATSVLETSGTPRETRLLLSVGPRN